MKKLFFLIACLAVMTAYAQNSSLGFNYQAVVRNAEGLLLSDTLVNLRVSLYPGQHANTPTWVETHSVHTDFTGSFGITIGHGERDASSLAESIDDINFATIFYWMKIEILEGNTYHSISYLQIPIVPVAKYALNASPCPTGSIQAFAGDELPDGWLWCWGDAISRTEYSDLYRVIGVNFGNGDGSTTFNLPDTRGMFLRGVSGDSGNDPDAHLRVNEHGGNTGNNVGSTQEYAVPIVTGTFKSFDRGVTGVSGAFYDTDDVWSSNVKGGNGDDWGAVTGFDNSLVTNTSIESRPKNIYVNYIIKY
jgi:hypothetical protein